MPHIDIFKGDAAHLGPPQPEEPNYFKRQAQVVADLKKIAANLPKTPEEKMRLLEMASPHPL
ncbi:MAG: hypothetical protein P4M15_11760 [Alphaproteobacteria bacterium]|nr:hypothetical protein [Alphaproteobacteria bacterium]